MSENLPVVNLLGVCFEGHNKTSLLALINNRIQARRKTLVLSGNIHAFNLAYEQAWLHDLFSRADVIRVDGAGVRVGARFLGYALPPRMTWADFVWDLAKFSAENDYRLFFLGGRPGVADEATHPLTEKFPNLQIVGCQHGYFHMDDQDLDNEVVLRRIADSRPDILIVGMGMPVQERWITNNWEHLDAPIIMTAGAVFDYISGRLQRPAPIFTRNGFEWLGRFLIEPRRLWRRYLIGNPLFFWRIFKQRLNLWAYHLKLFFKP